MTERIRVVHVVESLETGGMERMVSALARSVDRDRFACSVLCLKRTGPVARELVQASIPVHLYTPGPGASRYLAFRGLSSLLRTLNAHVVHTHNSPALFFGTTAAWLARVPGRVHTEHGRVFPDATKYMLAEYVLSRLLFRYVCVSERTRDDVARFERISPRKLEVVPNGVEAPAPVSERVLHALRQSFNIPENTRVVGALGRLVAEKGLDRLLKAWPAVIARCPAARLLIVGDGPLRAQLVEQAQRLDIAETVHFAGVRTDVNALHKLFDIFVMSSISEGLPLALLEAMAAGRPVVATRVGGMPDALEQGKAGVLVAPADPAGLADAIIQLLTQPTFAATVASQARQRFLDRFDVSIMARKYEQLYLSSMA